METTRAVSGLVGEVRDRVSTEKEAYESGTPRPLGGYAAILAAYAAGSAGLGLLVRRKRALPERPSLGDLALIAVATHKLSRMISKDTVLGSLRAPFTVFREAAGAGEVNEDVRGRGARHAVGELVSCPFCLDQWVATGLTFGLLLAPRATRQIASIFAVVAASDTLHLAYDRLK
jgi:hypothetical protein